MESWNLTFLFVHLLAAVAIGKLHRLAPCWMQRWVCAGLVAAMLILASAFALKINGTDGYIYVIWLGFAIEHLAVLFYAFRLVHKELLCPPSGLKRSPR